VFPRKPLTQHNSKLDSTVNTPSFHSFLPWSTRTGWTLISTHSDVSYFMRQSSD